MKTAFLSLLFLGLACTAAAKTPTVLRISGPPITESIPLMMMEGKDQPWEQDFEARFIPWNSPDMLRAMVAGQQVDAAIVTTAAASTLKSKGVKCKLTLLHESPVWIVSTQPGSDRLEDLEGTLLFPFGPGEMPELFYRAILGEKKVNLVTRHTGGVLEAVNLLLVGKGDHAMLSEPTASIAMLRAKALQSEGAPLLVKRIDMRRAWESSFPGHRLVASGIAFFGPKADDTEQMRAFNRAYALACEWVRQHPKETRQLVERKFPALAAQLQQGEITDFEFRIMSGEKAQEDAMFFLCRIREISPAAIGGALPGSDLFEVAQ
ncbi:hypothetical protein GKC30_03960 [Pseudodesulfovibrio sp. F-1]|uniref:ABC transporter substrate-binding protein n=1 Tax=Pseudodesulfovibrio alkaliphilus TaxID=2661613 RepID=A0A7K1KL92_9BACT|nr:ABC transporter substrate-binding protein [Pseudodesulfovibrio alkaliphilus]MUM76787.1 hypothetical protein [Pseudodesulfovibrio alkaliphilus]